MSASSRLKEKISQRSRNVPLFLGLLEIVWMNFRRVAVENPLAQGFAEFSKAQKLGMNWRWEARRLVGVYRFPAFRPRATVRGVFGDPKVRIVRLERRGKKLCAEPVVGPRAESTIASCARCETSRRETPESIWSLSWC